MVPTHRDEAIIAAYQPEIAIGTYHPLHYRPERGCRHRSQSKSRLPDHQLSIISDDLLKQQLHCIPLWSNYIPAD